MKKKKKKKAKVRLTWVIHPATRVEKDDVAYDRRKQKKEWWKRLREEGF